MDVHAVAIEEAAFAAWPAAEVATVGNWKLRFNHGATNRGNSVWCAPSPASKTAAANWHSELGTAEAFYAARGQPTLVQVSPTAPPGLDSFLEAQGYALHSPVAVQTAETTRVVELARTDAATGCEERPSADWLELSTTRGRYPGDRAAIFTNMLAKLEGRAGFAWAQGEDGVNAVGLTVLAPPLAGIFAMRTDDVARGRGLGTAVLGALARWASARGAEQLYLQVEPDYEPALRLYQRAGFATRYRYHYRRRARAEPSDPSP